jgi:hypothetical protein
MTRQRNQPRPKQVKPHPHLSEHDMNLLRPCLERLAEEIEADFGAPWFGKTVRDLTVAIKVEIDPDERIESTNGFVPLCNADETVVVSALEELAKERTLEILHRLSEALESGGRAYPSDCDLLQRNALVHGALITYNSRQARGGGNR